MTVPVVLAIRDINMMVSDANTLKPVHHIVIFKHKKINDFLCI